MPTISIQLPYAYPARGRTLVCKPTQCTSCPIYNTYCLGWHTCCGSNNPRLLTKSQRICQNQCDACLGMHSDITTKSNHMGTWTVCGKPESVLRNTIPKDLPLPTYKVGHLDLPSRYIPTFPRLPRGEFRNLPNLGPAGIGVADITSKGNSPESWLRYTSKPIILCSEQDWLQDNIEGWYIGKMPVLRKQGSIYACTGIEFSCYLDFGNLSHYYSLYRALDSCNAIQAELMPFYPLLRLRGKYWSTITAWLNAVPNLFVPYFTTGTIVYDAIDRALKINPALHIYLYRFPVAKLPTIPKHIRSRVYWFDDCVFPSALHGGIPGQDTTISKVDLFLANLEVRRATVNRILGAVCRAT